MQAMHLLAEYTQAGQTVDKAATLVSAKLDVKLSKAAAQKLLELRRRLRMDDYEEAELHTRQLVKKAFNDLSLKGVVGEEALLQVTAIRDWPVPPHHELIQFLQYEAEQQR
jgi:hypothetical protein